MLIERIRPEEKAEVLGRYAQLRKRGTPVMECCEIIANETGRSPESIWYIKQHYTPTVDIAEAYLKASAYKMTRRMVRKADARLLSDILSRPNIGVLAPESAPETSTQSGFFLNVSADACGAVSVKAAIGPVPPALPPHTPPTAIEGELVTTEQQEEESHAQNVQARRAYQGRFGRFADQPKEQWSRDSREAVGAARQRLAPQERRRERHPGSRRPVPASLIPQAEESGD